METETIQFQYNERREGRRNDIVNHGPQTIARIFVGMWLTTLFPSASRRASNIEELFSGTNFFLRCEYKNHKGSSYSLDTSASSQKFRKRITLSLLCAIAWDCFPLTSLHGSLSVKCIMLTLRCIYRLSLCDALHMKLMRTITYENESN